MYYPVRDDSVRNGDTLLQSIQACNFARFLMESHMQSNKPATPETNTDQRPANGPELIDPSEFQLVSGGAPRGGWDTDELQAPRGGWDVEE